MTRGPTGRATSAARDHGVAAAWGFAEATFFFIVPDVWTSWVGLRRPKRALRSTVSALAGAMAGGVATYLWSSRRSEQQSRRALAAIPGITATMVDQVNADVARRGHITLLQGPSRGVPYKLYARASGLQERSMTNFLVWTVPGRLVRFVVVTAAVSRIAATGRRVFPNLDERAISGVFVVCWAGFYAVFIPVVTRKNQ